jgi:hypothetical protein
VQDLEIVKGLHSSNNLNEEVPKLFLAEASRSLFVICNHFHYVSSISVVHNYAQRRCRILKECLLISDDIWMLDGSQNADLIECILALPLRQLDHLYLLHGILCAIRYPLYPEYRAVGTLTYKLLKDQNYP